MTAQQANLPAARTPVVQGARLGTESRASTCGKQWEQHGAAATEEGGRFLEISGS